MNDSFQNHEVKIYIDLSTQIAQITGFAWLTYVMDKGGHADFADYADVCFANDSVGNRLHRIAFNHFMFSSFHIFSRPCHPHENLRIESGDEANFAKKTNTVN